MTTMSTKRTGTVSTRPSTMSKQAAVTAVLIATMCATWPGASMLRSQEPADTAVTVFADVSVLTMDADSVLHDGAVVVRGEEIAWIGPASELDVPTGAQLVDGSGRWLMPGLTDVHVHIEASDLPLFLVNGVTTIREMNGTVRHVALRDSIDRGLRLGPRMIVTSALLAGEEQPWRHELIEGQQGAYRAAHRAQETGFEYLKVYDGLSESAYRALAEASATLGLPLTGHVPAEVGLETVLSAGQKSIEHAEQIMYATVGHRPDTTRIPEIVARIQGTGTWVTPTLASQRMLSLRRTSAYAERLERPEVRFVDPELVAWWESFAPANDAADPPPDDPRPRRARAFYGFLRDLTRALYEADVPLLVGTDTPNPLLVPGYSIHLELVALVEAGIPTAEVLRAATTGAARFTGAEGRRGVVRTGAAADLLLLEADPRERLETLETPVGVMAAGRWLNRQALGRMLDDVGS